MTTMRKNIVILIAVAVFAALLSWGLGKWFFSDEIKKVQYSTIQIEIKTEFPQLDKDFFNTDSVDTFTKTPIGSENAN